MAFRHALLSAAALGGGVLFGSLNGDPAFASCSEDDYLASICWTAATYCPRDFAQANGQVLAISQNPALFSLIGTYFGGNGVSSMGLPDLRGRTMAGVGTTTSKYPVSQGMIFGRERISLTKENIPAHTHSYSLHHPVNLEIYGVSDTGTQTSPEGALPAARPSSGPPPQRIPVYSDDWVDGAMADDALSASLSPGYTTTENSGSASPTFGARPPQIALTPCIKIQGAFPERSG